MDLKNLSEKYNILLAHMKENEYSEKYISRTRKMIKRILALGDNQDIQSYQDVYLELVCKNRTCSTIRCYKTFIGIVQQFDECGTYPNRINRQAVWRTANYYMLIPCFKKIVDEYREEAGKANRKVTTIQGEVRNASSFLAFIQKRGVSNLTEITQNVVVAYFTDEHGYPNKSYSLKKQIAAVFKICSSLYPDGECKRVLSYLPKLKRIRKNIPYLTKTETAAIKSVLLTPSTQLTLRDKAIGLLALETGLRCCDITGLKLSSINWEKESIYLTQQKTSCPLELPLTTHCGNALHDYILHERPKTDTDEIFVRSVLPYIRLESRSLTQVAARIAKVASVRQNSGDRTGFHLYRHRLATDLLENNVPTAIISKALGHTSPKSVEVYFGVDFVHLKECALSLKDYTINLEVVLK